MLTTLGIVRNAGILGASAVIFCPLDQERYDLMSEGAIEIKEGISQRGRQERFNIHNEL